MALKSLEQVREAGPILTSDSSPEISITPRPTDFRDNTWSEDILHPIQDSSWIASGIMDETNGVDNTPDPDFNLYAAVEDTEYEENADYFTDAFNDQYMDALKLRFNREQRNRASVERGGWSSWGWSMAGALLGPENFIPGTLAVRGAKQGYSLAKSAANVGASGFAATVLSEYGLHQSQGLRTKEESAFAIGAGTIFSMGFGVGLAALANKGIRGKIARKIDEASSYSSEFKKKFEGSKDIDPEAQAALYKEADDIILTAKKEEIERAAQVSEEFRSKLNDVDDIDARIDELYAATRDLPGFGKGGDLGAASSAKTIDDLTLRGSAARAYTGASKYLHPYTRIMTQPSPWAREMAANLFENNLLLRLHESEALSSAVETNVKRWADAYLADALGRIGHDGKGGIYRNMRKANIQMELPEFREQISRALRRNDGNAVDNEGNDLGAHSGQFNEYVMKAAKTVRDDVLEKGRLELNKIGRTLASKQSKTALSYLTRVWNRKKLAEGEAEFKDRNGVVWNYLNKALNAGIDDAAKKIETRIKNLTSEIHDLEDAARRRDSEYKERTGVSISELQEFDQINARLDELKAKLESGPQIDPEAGAAFGDDVVEALNRMLPPELRLEVVDEIERVIGRSPDSHDPRILYNLSDDEPRAKSTTDSLRGTHIKAPKELFDWLGVREAKFSADYEAIAKKRAENLPDDPLTDPTVLRDHVEYVLSKAVFAFQHEEGNWNLIAFDSSERLVSVDLEYKRHSYRVVTALTPDPGQLERKIRAVFKTDGEAGFKWKADPSPSRSGVPQDVGFVNRTGAKSPLSADDVIKKVRDLQPKTGELYQLPGMHSSTIKAAEELKLTKGTGEQWLNTIKKAQGVKQEELDWMGIEEFLKGKKGVTKEEVLDFMQAHRIEIEETIYTPYLSPEDLTGGARHKAKFQDYTQPGGIKYKEIAFSIPDDRRGVSNIGHFGPANTFAHARVKDRVTSTGQKVLHIEEIQSDLHKTGRNGGYNTPPSPEKIAELQDQSRIATEAHSQAKKDLDEHIDNDHVRGLIDRVNAVLDVPAEGLDKGIYRLITLKKNQAQHNRFILNAVEAKDATLINDVKNSPFIDDLVRLADHEEILRLRAHEADMQLKNPSSGVPDLPFKGAKYQELVLKRLIGKAIDEGYDGITLNKGIDIAERSAGQHIKAEAGQDFAWGVEFDSTDLTKYDVSVLDTNGTRLYFPVDEVDRLFKRPGLADEIKASVDDYHASIKTGDKEIYHEPEGSFVVNEDIAIPNGGFRLEYDQQLPRFLQKYTKKWGAKIERAEVLENATSNPYLKFTTEMKEAIKEGGQFYRIGDNNQIQGAFNPREKLMQIVRSAVDPQSTGQHELIHALKSMKLLQDDEWSLLEQSAKEFGWVEKHNINDRYKDVYEGNHQDIDNLMLEEAVAEEFGLWRQGKLDVTPELQTIFQKIMDFLNTIAESLRARGIENYDDIFELIESGDIANRGRQQMEAEAHQLTARRDQIQLAGEQGTSNELREGLLPSEVQQALRVLNDPETPKMPQTLRQFIQKEGGLLDQGGELKNRGWSKTTHPKLVKDVFIRNQIDAFNQSPNGSKKDGWTLDEMTQRLWEDGYFQERPSVHEMLDALSDDMSGTPHVRQSDELDLNLFLDRMALADELDRLGIDPSKRRHLHHTKDEERNLIAAVGKIMNNQDAEKIMKLKRKLDDAEFKKMSIPDIDDVNEVDEIVKSVFRKLMGEDVADDFVNENIVDYGFLKGRTFGIRDELVEHWLENDIEAILRSYVRNISGQIEMQKRFGSMDLEPHFSKIKDEFEKERGKVFADTNLNDKQRKKAIDKLWTQEGDADRTLKFVRDKILGRYKNDIEVNTWTRTLDGAMGVQYMAALGGVLPSSLADMWRIPMTQGMARYFGKDLPRLISGNKGLKLNRKLAKKYVGIAEIVNNSRLAQIIGLNDPYIHQNPAEVFITKATSTFSKLTAMPYWNQFWKEFAGATVIDRALGNLMKGLDNVNGVERRWTNEAGFGMLAPYMGQLRQAKAVEKIQGVWTLHPDRVPDDLASQFYGAVKKEIDRTIITPGLADLPIRMHHPLGKAAFQFKSFGFASDQKMLMRGMQDDVGNMMGGLMGMASVGMFIYMLKTLEAGRELDDNPAKWVLEGIDRSGMFFVMFEANNVAEKLGLPGAYWASGARAPASRFATRNLSSSLMGPVFGSTMDVAALFGSGAAYLHPGREGDITPTDIANARRITPYASLPPWRWAIDNYLVPALKDEVK